MAEDTYYYAVGRRKEAVARVRMTPGNSAIIITRQPLAEIFKRTLRQATQATHATVSPDEMAAIIAERVRM